MTMFALVRSSADLEPAFNDIRGYFSFRRRRDPAWRPEPLLGVWMEPNAVRMVPARLEWWDDSSRLHAASVVHSFGTSPLWAVCSLDDNAIDRCSLLQALVNLRLHCQYLTSPGRFVPVFKPDMPAAASQKQMAELIRHFPDRVDGALLEDYVTGQLNLIR